MPEHLGARCHLLASCKNSTFNDTAIYCRELLPFIKGMSVPHEHTMAARTPLFIEFDFGNPTVEDVPQWHVPQSWINFQPSAENIGYYFEKQEKWLDEYIDDITCVDPGEAALIKWSELIESSVHQSIQYQHSQAL